MSSVKLPDDLIEEARKYSAVYSRSVPKQIEYWFRIGKIAEENPDLTYQMIKDILLSLQEAADGPLQDYKFG